MGSPRAAASNKGGLEETSYFHSSNAFARWLHELDLISQRANRGVSWAFLYHVVVNASRIHGGNGG